MRLNNHTKNGQDPKKNMQAPWSEEGAEGSMMTKLSIYESINKRDPASPLELGKFVTFMACSIYYKKRNCLIDNSCPIHG